MDDDVTRAQFDDDAHAASDASTSMEEAVVAKHYTSQQQLPDTART